MCAYTKLVGDVGGSGEGERAREGEGEGEGEGEKTRETGELTGTPLLLKTGVTTGILALEAGEAAVFGSNICSYPTHLDLQLFSTEQTNSNNNTGNNTSKTNTT